MFARLHEHHSATRRSRIRQRGAHEHSEPARRQLALASECWTTDRRSRCKARPSYRTKRSPTETVRIPDHRKLFRIATCPTAKTNAKTAVSGLCRTVEERPLGPRQRHLPGSIVEEQPFRAASARATESGFSPRETRSAWQNAVCTDSREAPWKSGPLRAAS